jgi:hypothetical protein
VCARRRSTGPAAAPAESGVSEAALAGAVELLREMDSQLSQLRRTLESTCERQGRLNGQGTDGDDYTQVYLRESDHVQRVAWKFFSRARRLQRTAFGTLLLLIVLVAGGIFVFRNTSAV